MKITFDARRDIQAAIAAATGGIVYLYTDEVEVHLDGGKRRYFRVPTGDALHVYQRRREGRDLLFGEDIREMEFPEKGGPVQDVGTGYMDEE